MHYRCPACQNPFPDSEPPPQAQDIAVCGGCIGVFVWDAALQLRAATAADYAAMSPDLRDHAKVCQALAVYDRCSQRRRVERHWIN